MNAKQIRQEQHAYAHAQTAICVSAILSRVHTRWFTASSKICAMMLQHVCMANAKQDAHVKHHADKRVLSAHACIKTTQARKQKEAPNQSKTIETSRHHFLTTRERRRVRQRSLIEAARRWLASNMAARSVQDSEGSPGGGHQRQHTPETEIYVHVDCKYFNSFQISPCIARSVWNGFSSSPSHMGESFSTDLKP